MKQWNRIFKQYGKIFTKPEEDIPKVIKLFERCNVKRVLDLGCGSGRHIIYLAKHGFKVYGIDIAEEGIKITKERLKNSKLRANLRIGSVYKKLPYKNNFFDAIICTQVLHHAKVKTIRKAIREIERILKPNGIIFITVRKRRFNKYKIKFKVIEPRAYIPLEGREKGLIHYIYNKELLRKDFNNFKIHNLWVDSGNRHYCLIAELKSL